MFLIELDSGTQQLYSSPAELAAAIRRGELGPGARIYHRISGQWLPITVHPEFKRGVAQQARAPLPPLARSRWTFFSTEAGEAVPGGVDPAAGRSKDSPLATGNPNAQPKGGLRRTLDRTIKYIRSMGRA